MFETEHALVGDLDALGSAEKSVTLGSGADAGKVKAMLDGIRSENPQEPFWLGVKSVEETTEGVQLSFHEGYDPLLRPSGGVEVACVLHPTPVTPEPALPEAGRPKR